MKHPTMRRKPEKNSKGKDQNEFKISPVEYSRFLDHNISDRLLVTINNFNEDAANYDAKVHGS